LNPELTMTEPLPTDRHTPAAHEHQCHERAAAPGRWRKSVQGLVTCLAHALPTALPALALLSVSAAQAAEQCHVRADGPAPTVVELYTSEGCSSCPPAEAWLNGLKSRPGVLALSFHVNYWDYLGWPDRFASPEATQRQRQLARVDGRSGVYTPQVRVGGQDWRGWPDLPRDALKPGPVLELARDGEGFVVRVEPWQGKALAGYWAVLEDRHESRVRAGENSGSTLRHDHVVRLYKPLEAWPVGQAVSSRLAVSRGVAEHPRRVAFVVVDAKTRRPLQAAELGC
jgi:hypothetical protein